MWSRKHSCKLWVSRFWIWIIFPVRPWRVKDNSKVDNQNSNKQNVSFYSCVFWIWLRANHGWLLGLIKIEGHLWKPLDIYVLLSDLDRRYQTYTAPCNGIIRVFADYPGGNKRKQNASTIFAHMPALVSCTVQLFTHVNVYAQTAVDAGNICTW